MRELKFRVWNIALHEFLPIEDICISKASRLFFCGKVERIYAGGRWFSPYECNIEQYTGINDKNGKEIYEGDIVKFRGRAYEVKFDDYGQFCIENEKYHWLSSSYSFNSVDIWCAEGILVEIIGNIHENPELIGGKK